MDVVELKLDGPAPEPEVRKPNGLKEGGEGIRVDVRWA